jgi:hypothetical protein
VRFVIAALLLPSSLSPQTPGAKLLADARAGTARYRSVDSAIADGFKRVGVEFPAMGEHWVNLPRVLEDRFDAARPSVLIYISANGTRTLAGVAYTALLDDGEQPPATAARLSDWHEHNGSIAEESLPLHHAAGMASGAAAESPRLSILHVWAWTPNPAGPFVTDNWTLPLARRGASARALSPEAMRGLTLAADSASYYEQTIHVALGASNVEESAIDRAVANARRTARAAIARDPSGADGDALAAAWGALWAELERSLPRRVDALRAVRRLL